MPQLSLQPSLVLSSFSFSCYSFFLVPDHHSQVKMASIVFGTPITNETLKGMAEYHDKEITQADRARVALEMKNAEGKDENARTRVMELCKDFGDTPATMGLIYNATGNAITFVSECDWYGHLFQSPYPTIIANGQWGIFLHGKYYNYNNYSKAAIVYSGKNNKGVEKEWLMSWANNRKQDDDYNRVFAEIRDPGHYAKGGILDYVRDKCLDAAPAKRLMHKANEDGGLLITSIGNHLVAFFEAIVTLPDALN